MSLKLTRTLFAAWTTLIFLSAHADVEVPPLAHRVTDLTATLSAQQAQTLEQTLAAFEEKKGTQIAVLIVPTTKPEEIEEYSIRVVDQWKLGRKKVDDGVLLLIAKDDRRVRIEVGYGLEGILPDAVANRIIEEEIAPRFATGDFYGGIVAGTDRIMGVINGESLPPPPAHPQPQPPSNLQSLLIPGLILVLVIAGFLRTIFGRALGATIVGAIAGVAIWFVIGTFITAFAAGVIAFLVALSGGTLGRWGGYYPGGGGGVVWGGGGFSGGGGGFGGGGASGRW